MLASIICNVRVICLGAVCWAAAVNTALVIHEHWVVPAAWGHYAIGFFRSPGARLIFV